MKQIICDFSKMFDLKLNSFHKCSVILPFILMVYLIYSNIWTLLFVFWFLIIFYYLKLKFTIPFGEHDFAEYKPSALVILGSGGHSWEMFNILSKIEWQRYLPIYAVGYSDPYTLCNLNSFENSYKRNYFTERLTRPREHCHTSILSPIVLFRSFYCFIESFLIIYRHKPNYLISNGPSICVPPTIAASLLRKIGLINTKIIYIESAARVKTLSTSATILRNLVDSMFAFWPQLCETHGLLPLFSHLFKTDFSDIIHQKTSNPETKIKNNNKKALVTVGTTEFAELVSVALSEHFGVLLLNNGFTHLTVQIGSLQLYENLKQKNNASLLKTEIIKILPSHKFFDLLKEADLVVSHGGAATVLQALTYGKKIIVVPNERLRNNHQLELVLKLQELHLIDVSSAKNLINFIHESIKLVNYSNFTKFKFNPNEYFRKSIGESRLRKQDFYYKKNENERQFSVVIPATINDIEYLANLLKSLQKFICLSSVSTVLIIVPIIDFNKMIRFMSFGESLWQKKIRFIKETELIPESVLCECNSFPKWRSGWYKQQLLKLSAAFFVDTLFYLVLDSDCILTKSLKYSDLIYENKNQFRSYYQTEDIILHQNWWRGSAKLLGINSTFLDSLNDGIGVTPQTLSVKIVKELCSFIEKSHPNKGKWYSILSKFRIQLYPTAIWTEYTLYYLFAIRTGILHKHHILKRNALANYNHCVWQLHQSYDWNPFVKSENYSSFFTLFQSNVKLSHRIPRAFLSQYTKNDINSFISCIMILENIEQNIDENMIYSSVSCFCRQRWPSVNRELLIVCDKDTEDLVKGFIYSFVSSSDQIIVIVADKLRLFKKWLEIAKGDYIAFWPYFSWSSPYRLSVQFQYIKDMNIDSCHISPFISGDPVQEKFYISDKYDHKIDSFIHEMPVFCKRDVLSQENISFKSKPLNEPTLHINIISNCLQKSTSNLYAIQKLQPIDSVSHLNELIRISGPFVDNSLSFSKRKHRKIYFISSELEFSPFIGGINTFLRVIISQLKDFHFHLENNIEVVFCGIKCGDKEPAAPEAKGLTFKFFQTENSKKVSDLEKYFKSFAKYSSTIDDLKNFGHSALSWIRSDAIPGDICVTTIVYECEQRLLKELVLRGVKLVHTVHSLVPLKIMFNSRCIPFKKLHFKDIIRTIFFNIFKLDEYKLVMISKTSFLRWILPKFITESLEKENFIMSLSQAVFVPSRKLAKITASLYPNIKHKVRYVPWGLPKGPVIGDPLISYDSTKNLSDSTKIKCLALCKLVPQKGVDLLLDAFNCIEKMDPKLANRLQLNICGDMSYMEENKFLSILEKKVNNLKLIEVKINGWLTGQLKLDQLRKAHFFVSPSLTEPFGFSLLESMKSGLPVVSFATEGPLDIVSSEFGRLVPISQDFDLMAKDFAIAIIDLCYSKNYEQMCEKSYKAANEWSLDILFENLLSIF